MTSKENEPQDSSASWLSDQSRRILNTVSWMELNTIWYTVRSHRLMQLFSGKTKTLMSNVHHSAVIPTYEEGARNDKPRKNPESEPPRPSTLAAPATSLALHCDNVTVPLVPSANWRGENLHGQKLSSISASMAGLCYCLCNSTASLASVISVKDKNVSVEHAPKTGKLFMVTSDCWRSSCYRNKHNTEQSHSGSMRQLTKITFSEFFGLELL